MKVTDLVKRVDELVELGNAVLLTQSSGGEFNDPRVKSAPMAGFRSAALSFIDRVYESKHPHFFKVDTKNI